MRTSLKHNEFMQKKKKTICNKVAITNFISSCRDE